MKALNTTSQTIKGKLSAAVATTQPGRTYRIICQNTGVLTLDGNASETINGATTFAMTAGTVGGITGRAAIVSDGTQWFTLYSQ